MTFIHPDVPPREITARIRAQIAAQVPDGPALIAAFETIPPWGGRRTADLRAIEAWKRKHHALLKEAKIMAPMTPLDRPAAVHDSKLNTSGGGRTQDARARRAPLPAPAPPASALPRRASAGPSRPLAAPVVSGRDPRLPRRPSWRSPIAAAGHDRDDLRPRPWTEPGTDLPRPGGADT